MKKSIFIFILLLQFVAIAIKAQPTMDTIKACLKQKPHPFFDFNSRNSFIENSRAKIFGFKLGVSYGRKLSFGIGYNQLYPPATGFDKDIYFVSYFGLLQPVTEHLKMYYLSLDVEYSFYQTKHWQLNMPLQIGFGETYYKYSFQGENVVTERKFNFIYEPSISINYKFVKWIGVGADVGFRFMVTSDRQLNRQFNSPTYAFNLLIYYSEIYKSLFPNTKLAKSL